jgi:hypothetical protein
MFDIEVSEEFQVGNSSITDSEMLASYPSLCGSAVKNSEIFKKFRSSRVMVEALDHVSIEQGNDYIAEILKYTSWSEKFTLVLVEIDKVGKPRKFRTPEGLGLSDRQVEYYEKLLAARYITYAVYDYPKLKKIQLPEKKYESIRNMLQPLLTMMNPLEDILLGSEEYTTFLRKKVRRKKKPLKILVPET